MTAPVVLGVDVGGTSFKAALIDAAGRTLLADSIATEGAQGEAAFARLSGFVGRVLAAGGAAGIAPVACGLISPGMDEHSGRVLYSSNLDWRDFPLAARLGPVLGSIAVAPGHDVRTAGLAEAQMGAARGLADSAFVMIGTGIAAALVSGGQPIAGAAQMACELGHIPVYPDGEPCPCGQIGCLEAYASAAAIARRYRAAGGRAVLTAAAVSARLGDDPIAARVWAEAVQALALSLATVTLLLDPAAIVIGGGLAEADEALLGPVRAALERRLAWRAPPPVVRSRLGGRGALLGAAILAFRSLGRGELAAGWQAEA